MCSVGLKFAKQNNKSEMKVYIHSKYKSKANKSEIIEFMEINAFSQQKL